MVEIRALKVKDHAGVLAVAEALPEWFDADARGRAIPVDLCHQQGFVALFDEKVIGFITLYVSEGRLNISWLGVEPSHWRSGIGSELIARAERYATELGLTEIATCTLGEGVDYRPYEATRKFYLVNGFTVYQRSQTDNRSCPEEIKIKKRIA